ncbi:hypothetical protein J4E85_009407 [Alternaria conjuncta]|uniref:uncharacterized protein n=1 Tax=Alternaria conjuncta TaxID=181017 RepID=UPI00221FF3C1|nr:uncharacterized protein J4E85_009407 [Alternaria conjuncta]KAI4919150.1 hypothetical protein J4E85_009407 [Alternaria conjuncta]
MHVSEASAPHLHLRNDPVNSSADDGQAKLSNATPQFHVAASVESGPVLPDTIAPNGALADTTHENVTSRCTRLRSYSSDETPVVVETKSTIAKLQPCYSCGEIGTGNHLKVPSTPHRRRDSFHKSSASSEGDNDSELEEHDLEQSFASLRVAEGCQELQSKLFEALQRTWNPNGHDQEFLPKGELYRLINTETVAQVLKKDLSRIHTHERIRLLAQRVCSETRVLHRGKEKIKTFRKIFALLVIAEYTSSISLFLDEDVSDLDLPLISTKTSKGKKGFCRRDTSGKPINTPLECFQHDDWSSIKVRNFEQFQWDFLAPFFARDDDGDVKHYVLDNQHILPFIPPHNTEDEDADRTGGFGKVFMVRIHGDHHNFRDERLSHRGFAIKQQLHEMDRDAFKKEIIILKSFSENIDQQTAGPDADDHMMDPYLDRVQSSDSFERPASPVVSDRPLWRSIQPSDVEQLNSRQPMLLEHADLGVRPLDSNTGSVGAMKHARKQVDFDKTSHFPRQQMHEKKFGRHGDINPGNILWYDDCDVEKADLKGTMKLADFGQAELNTLLSRTQPRDVANTLTYRPPECDLQPKIVRQSYDIWCLGCVYLEFVTWVLGGKSLLLSFSQKRSTPDMFQNNHKSDTFFQVVRDQETGQPEVMIKKAVTLVCRSSLLPLFR